MKLSRVCGQGIYGVVMLHRRRLIDRINNSLHARELLIRREWSIMNGYWFVYNVFVTSEKFFNGQLFGHELLKRTTNFLKAFNLWRSLFWVIFENTFIVPFLDLLESRARWFIFGNNYCAFVSVWYIYIDLLKYWLVNYCKKGLRWLQIGRLLLLLCSLMILLWTYYFIRVTL